MIYDPERVFDHGDQEDHRPQEGYDCPDYDPADADQRSASGYVRSTNKPHWHRRPNMNKVTTIAIALLIAITATAAAQDVTEIGAWSLHVTEDVMTGAADYVLINEAEAHSGTLQPPAFVVRPAGDSVDVVVHWGGYSLERGTKQIIVMADGERSTVPVDESTTRKALFMRQTFMDAMPFYTTVAMQTETATGREMVGRWDMTGYAEALETMLAQE